MARAQLENRAGNGISGQEDDDSGPLDRAPADVVVECLGDKCDNDRHSDLTNVRIAGDFFRQPGHHTHSTSDQERDSCVDPVSFKEHGRGTKGCQGVGEDDEPAGPEILLGVDRIQLHDRLLDRHGRMCDHLQDLMDLCKLVHVESCRDLEQVGLRSMGLVIGKGYDHDVGHVDALQVKLQCPGCMVNSVLESVGGRSKLDHCTGKAEDIVLALQDISDCKGNAHLFFGRE